jgi:hypothetical protein
MMILRPSKTDASGALGHLAKEMAFFLGIMEYWGYASVVSDEVLIKIHMGRVKVGNNLLGQGTYERK